MSLPPFWDHQTRAVEAARPLPYYGLFMEPGTGKTRTTTEILREKFNAYSRVLRTLVLSPKITLENWKDEWLKFTKVPASRVVVLSGTGPQRLKIFRKAKADYPDGFIVISNYEALVAMPELHKELMEWCPEALVCDESQRVKEIKSKRTKAVIQLADKAKYRYILSGTPVLKSPMDLFSQFRILDKGHLFGQNFFVFRARYFVDKNAGMPRDRYFPNWVLRDGAMLDIRARITGCTISVKKSECLDLPPLVKKVINVPLSPVQKKHYEEMKNDFITYINDKAAVASLAIVKALRLQQIVSGHLPLSDEDNTIAHFEKTPREEALKELLEQLTPDHKVIVWACFRQNYETIRNVCTDLGLEYVEVHGEISDKNKFAAVDKFRTDPKVRVYLGHPASGGIGINLVESSYSIRYSRNFKLEDQLQSDARNYRGGSEMHESITQIELVTPGTIDEEVMKSLANKEAVGDMILKSFASTIQTKGV